MPPILRVLTGVIGLQITAPDYGAIILGFPLVREIENPSEEAGP